MEYFFLLLPILLAGFIGVVGVVGIIVFFVVLKSPKTPAVASDMEFKAYCTALNNTEMHNLIISGGRASDRFLAVTSILNEAYKRKIPTIVLHSGFAPFNQFSQNTYYDPCIGKDSNEIAEIFTDAAANALNIDTVIHASLKLIMDILQAVKSDITLSDVVKFSYDDVIGYLDECRDSNSITDNQYDKFKQRYNNPAIRDNILRVAPLFQRLKTISQKSNSAQPINFQQAVADRQLLFLDLLSDSNSVLKELVFSDINKLTEINKFWVITEGISFIGKAESKVDTIFTKNRNNITLIYSGEDVPMLTSQTVNTFETLTGGNSQLLIFTHTSPSSAVKWSEHFGKENQEKISTTSGSSKRFLEFATKNEGVNVGTEEVFKFPPQHFMQSGQTKDINNNSVVWGLNNGECYFIKGNFVVQTQVTQSQTGISSFLSNLGKDDEKLPKITLQPTPLMLISQSVAAQPQLVGVE